ncbi:hypothetical protein DPMN_109509 [Dreissena polymorpha]|uniref:Uncharacterized protein n=1 Tax=Dreissena polymorpha TaxID=45954 RepID=A0A9D4KAW1_DREPO|nr:hypothetical protein DPMN_109509 [Dreissena polymorpha]
MPRPPGDHVFQATGTIFKLVQDIIGTNLLKKFHDDRTINVASRVLTRFYNSHKQKCPAIWTINVASRVLTRQMLTPHDANKQKAITKAHHELKLPRLGINQQSNLNLTSKLK